MKWIERAQNFTERTAVVSNGKAYSYEQLIEDTLKVATRLLGKKADLLEEPIAFMVNPSFEYVIVQWGIWAAGGIAVPLSTSHPLASIQYVLENTGAKTVIVGDGWIDFLRPLEKILGLHILVLNFNEWGEEITLPVIEPGRKAMILYTSGTTSKPKGVVTTHSNIEFQVKCLVEAWKWSEEDYILNVLPLHHVHGIINAMGCALWVGACCEFLPKFDAEKVWDRFKNTRVNVFMAVPTVYYKLIHFWENSSEANQKEYADAVAKFRLMVSGSAALPVGTLEKWKTISGHILLERYGMTEIGMALSNPYDGERKPGYVGLPLNGVQVRLIADGKLVKEGEQGEIQVKSPNVFLTYWNNPEATKKTFTKDGWFLTGDIAMVKDGYYKILGRDSVDIIKSGGYKISALEIEEVLRTFPGIKECAVVGVPDKEWGELVTAFLVSDEKNIDYEGIKTFLKEKIPLYKIPRNFYLMDELPRNALGKVTKNELKKLKI